MESKSNIISLIREGRLSPSIILDSRNCKFLETQTEDIIRVLVCPDHSYPSDNCSTCLRFEKKILPNVWVLDSQDQFLKKEELRNCLGELSAFALEKNLAKVLVIKGAEHLHKSSANTFLKFLEEPPTNTFIFLLSSDYWGILPTIRSRCVRYTLINLSPIAESSHLEKIFHSQSKREFLTLSHAWMKLAKNELISDLNQAYSHFIIKNYPQLALPTLTLLGELHQFSLHDLATTRYLIEVEEMITRKFDENL